MVQLAKIRGWLLGWLGSLGCKDGLLVTVDSVVRLVWVVRVVWLVWVVLLVSVVRLLRVVRVVR